MRCPGIGCILLRMKTTTYEQAVVTARKAGFARKFTRALDSAGIPDGLLAALTAAAVNNGASNIERKIEHRVAMARDAGDTASDAAVTVAVLCEIVEAYKYNTKTMPAKWAHAHSVLGSLV